MTGFVPVLCDQCQRVWVARPRGQHQSHGLCGAQGPNGYTCPGTLRLLDPEDSFGDVMLASLLMGGWEAMVATLTTNPGWGWVAGGGMRAP